MKCPTEECQGELLRDQLLKEEREDDRQGEVLTEYVILKCPKCKRKFEVTAIYRVEYDLIDCYLGEEIKEKIPKVMESSIENADFNLDDGNEFGDDDE